MERKQYLKFKQTLTDVFKGHYEITHMEDSHPNINNKSGCLTLLINERHYFDLYYKEKNGIYFMAYPRESFDVNYFKYVRDSDYHFSTDCSKAGTKTIYKEILKHLIRKDTKLELDTFFDFIINNNDWSYQFKFTPTSFNFEHFNCNCGVDLIVMRFGNVEERLKLDYRNGRFNLIKHKNEELQLNIYLERKMNNEI